MTERVMQADGKTLLMIDDKREDADEVCYLPWRAPPCLLPDAPPKVCEQTVTFNNHGLAGFALHQTSARLETPFATVLMIDDTREDADGVPYFPCAHQAK